MNENEVRELIRRELTEERIREFVRKELLKILPDLLGRSLVQIKAFFTRNIT